MHKSLQPRSITCTRCKKKEVEKVFGTGFLGWARLVAVYTDKIITKKIIIDDKEQVLKEKIPVNPELCPECMQKLCKWIDEGEK